MTTLRNKWPVIAAFIVLFAYACYAAAYIWRSSFVIGGERYFCLFDDGMISMQYAKNLAAGNGLVFNAGEKIEGFTNPLWTLLMAGFHMMPVAVSKISLCVQIAGAVILFANLVFVYVLARRLRPDAPGIAIAALIFTATYLPLNTWGWQGMEVSVLALLTTAAALLAVRTFDRGRFDPAPYVLLGVGTFVRPDIVVPLLALTMFMGTLHRGFRRPAWIWGLAMLVLFAGAQTAFRYFYYGEFLPNTYYLKVTQYPFLLRISRGLFVFADFAMKANWLVLAVPLVLTLFRADPRPRLLAWMFLAQCAYSIYVGGDAWEWWGGANRYMCQAIALVFILAAIALADIGPWLAGHAASRWKFIRAGIARGTLWGVCVPMLVLNLNSLNGSLLNLTEWILYTKPFETDGNRRRTELALHFKAITRPEARIAVIYAGAIPYFSERYTIDLLGKMDQSIAHMPMLQTSGIWKFVYFYPGHLKRNYDYSIGKLKPDIVASLWYDDEDEARRNLKDYQAVEWNGRTFYLLNNSPNILWDKI